MKLNKKALLFSGVPTLIFTVLIIVPAINPDYIDEAITLSAIAVIIYVGIALYFLFDNMFD